MRSSKMQKLLSFFATIASATALVTPTFSRTFNSRTIEAKLALRILPIGDSITWGYGATDGNGYRLRLLDLLVNNTVTYIGSQHSGTMSNNNNEGYPGAIISQIATDVKQSGSLAQNPNLVLIMAGTNDVAKNDATSTAPARLGALIDEVQSACPNAVVIVAEITPNKKADLEVGVKVFNAAIPAIVAARSHVLAVNMSMYVPASDLKDSVHPTDAGYQLMAECWLGGIETAVAKGWFNGTVS